MPPEVRSHALGVGHCVHTIADRKRQRALRSRAWIERLHPQGARDVDDSGTMRSMIADFVLWERTVTGTDEMCNSYSVLSVLVLMPPVLKIKA